MGRGLIKYVVLAIFFAVGLGLAQDSDSLVEQAIKLYQTRHLDRSNLNASAQLLEKIVNAEPENLKALYEYSRVCYLLGDEAKDKKEKLHFYKMGIELGKRAKKIDDHCAEAHFWYLVNLGRMGQTKGVLNSLGLVPKIKREIDKVLKLDSLHTGALDARAMLYYELPGLLGGDLNKSIEALNKALRIDSSYTVLYVDMARVYMKKKNYERARWFLNRVLEIEEPRYEADYILHDRPEAIRLLKEIEQK